jgi:hypothetical protein
MPSLAGKEGQKQGAIPGHGSQGISYLLSKLKTINTSHTPGIRRIEFFD